MSTWTELRLWVSSRKPKSAVHGSSSSQLQALYVPCPPSKSQTTDNLFMEHNKIEYNYSINLNSHMKPPPSICAMPERSNEHCILHSHPAASTSLCGRLSAVDVITQEVGTPRVRSRVFATGSVGCKPTWSMYSLLERSGSRSDLKFSRTRTISFTRRSTAARSKASALPSASAAGSRPSSGARMLVCRAAPSRISASDAVPLCFLRGILQR